jgi:hypothetical protein
MHDGHLSIVTEQQDQPDPAPDDHNQPGRP